MYITITGSSPSAIVSSLSFDYSANYLAIGTTEGSVSINAVKDWSEVVVSW